MYANLPASVGYAAIMRDRPTAEARFADRRDIAAERTRFEQRAATIRDTEALLRDRRVLEPLLTAFGLEGEVAKLAVIRKVITENPADSASLANRLTDPRWRALARAFQGQGGARLADPAFRAELAKTFVTAAFEKREGGSDGLREALYFRRNAAAATSITALMADRPLAEVVRVALGLPDQFGLQDFDRQKAILSQRFDLSRLQDPAEVDRIARTYLARRAATAPPPETGIASLFRPFGG